MRTRFHRPTVMPALRRGLQLLTLAGIGLLPLATQGGIHRAPVSASVADKAARQEPVDVLVLLDDALEVRQLAGTVGAPAARARLDRAGYTHFAATQRALMRALKSDVLLQAADPDVDVLTDYDMLPVLHARVRSARALENLRRQGRVRSIDAIVRVRPALAESLPLIGQPTVAAAGHVGAGTSVAVLDTGVDYTRAAFGACSNPGGACKVAHAQDFATPDNALDTGNYHGTNVAGIVLGVAPATKILALDVFESDGLAYSNALLAAVNWCIANKAGYNIAAINMSLGGGQYTAALAPSDSFGVALSNAINAGIAVVVASGNNGYTNALAWPAAYNHVVSVGAFYDAGAQERQVTSFSNSASFLTLVAPGSMITAAGISMQGTSQAAPHVAGAAAVLRALYADDTVADLVGRLKLGGAVLDTRNGVSKPGLDLMASTAVPPATYRLTLLKAGSGAGTLSGNGGAIQCSDSCTTQVTNGDTVTLTALHGPNATFGGWSGACSGSGLSCSVAMTAARSVTATFYGRTSEDFIANGALPAGWSQPAGSAAGWSVDEGGAYVGPQALRSGTVGHGQSAAVRVSGTFGAGTVAFARRVSSQTGDALRFYIDGQLQGSWSGEVAWGMVAFPIGAGVHELTWAYEKDGSGSAGADAAWIDSVVLPFAATSRRTANADFNGDGRADILWRHTGDGRNAIWLMDGVVRQDGSGTAPQVGDTAWGIVGVGDVDGDGKADVVWRHAGSGQNALWTMDGVGRRSSTLLPTVADPNWRIVGVADFDGDGKADLLWRHLATGENAIWLMDGATRRSVTVINAVADTGWRVVGSADFDGDGKADVLWRHATNGQNALWLMNGVVRLSSTTLAAIGDPNWYIVGVGDLDGDAKADVVWRHAGTGQNAVWLMDGTTRRAATLVNSVTDLGWRVVGVADFDADGKDDILWRHAGTGKNALWTMDGTTRLGSVLLEDLADTAWRVAAH